MINKYKCPCCHNNTLSEEREYEICSVCGWEDDPIQFDDPNFRGGANSFNLNEARECFLNFSNNTEKCS